MTRSRRSRQLLLGAVVASLTLTALLAVGILLFGSFGETEGRILTTTALVAAYGLVALPAAFLADPRRLRPLGAALVALAATGFALAASAVWAGDAPAALGKTFGTITLFAVAAAQTAALAGRRSHELPLVRRLFRLSVVLVVVAASMASAAAWAELDGGTYYRVLGAVAILDVLAVALQPILAAGRSRRTVYALRVLLEPADELATTVEAPDFASAAAKAIRAAERAGKRPVGVLGG